MPLAIIDSILAYPAHEAYVENEKSILALLGQNGSFFVWLWFQDCYIDATFNTLVQVDTLGHQNYVSCYYRSNFGAFRQIWHTFVWLYDCLIFMDAPLNSLGRVDTA